MTVDENTTRYLALPHRSAPAVGDSTDVYSRALRAVIAGGDSAIGRAVAIAYARRRRRVDRISHEDQDAAEVAGLVEDAGSDAYSCPVTWPIRLTVAR